MSADDAVIYALASGAGRAAIAIVRLSGRGTSAILTKICGTCPPPRHASLRRLRDRSGGVLDHALVLYFPGPGSFTGEDSAELHLHGGRAVLRAVTAALSALGARPAEAGEFSRRATLAGRMDLLAAEGLADLIAAETEAQRRSAMRQMEGQAGALAHAWRNRLLEALAGQEALIDFPEEEVPADEAAFQREMAGLADAMAAAVAASRGADRLREGIVVAVVGAPNVGKSALVNALAAREVAIVSPVPGTTRDAIEVALELAGLPVVLVDTAGVRDSDDPVEREGVRRARARAADADIVLAVAEAGQDRLAEIGSDRVLAVVSKIDLAPPPPGALGVSARTGEGLDRLRAVLAERAGRVVTGGGGTPVLTRERHRASVLLCRERLAAALAADAPELRAEALRLALGELGRLTGAVHAEEVLDVVFSRFCIGK